MTIKRESSLEEHPAAHDPVASEPESDRRGFLERLAGCFGLGDEERKRSRDAREYWSDSARTERLRDQSHWRGHGRFASEAAWRAIGEKHRRLIETLRSLAGRRAPIERVLEWGPGGGSNAVALAPEIRHFVGVDISRPNLAECGRRLAESGFRAYQPVCIPADRPEAALAECSPPFDLFLSTAVFQHLPSKEYGARVTRCAVQALSPDGVALIQIRYDDGTRKFAPKHGNYRRNATFFTSFRIEEYWRIALEAGLEPLAITLEPAVNYAYYFLKRRPAAAELPSGGA